MNHFFIGGLIIFFGGAPADGADAPAQLSQALQARLDAYHKNAEVRDHRLRLVYFHPNDAAPQPGYRERLTRIMFDIRDFLGGEMKRNGFGERSIKLETEGEFVKLHLVEGRDGVDAYNYDQRYGTKILGEMREALRGTIDFERDFVLVFCGLCPKDGDGVYHFRSPYYGWGGSGAQQGLCFAADCEMLDTRHFTATKEIFRYTEHQGSFQKTLSAFNILYIGGIAHELGHGLGLPHNREKPWENQKLGRALMGSGNFTYRQELVGGRGSFLTRASALRLATHPMFTGSDRERFKKAVSDLDDLGFKLEGGALKVTGRVGGSPEIFAVIAYTDPNGGQNYDAHPWIAEVRQGRFEFTVRTHRQGPHALRLNFCHLNGGFSEYRLSYDTDGRGRPLAAAMNQAWAYGRAELAFLDGRPKETVRLAKAALEADGKGQSADKLRHLIALTEPAKPVKLSTAKANRISLSDVEWREAKVGWGGLARNQYYSGGGIRDGVCVAVGGRFHAKAIYAHAPARHVIGLDGGWKKLTATVGLQKGALANGSGVFVVRGDGKELHRTKVLPADGSAEIVVDVTGIRELELVTESGKRGNAGCWTVWGSPYVSR